MPRLPRPCPHISTRRYPSYLVLTYVDHPGVSCFIPITEVLETRLVCFQAVSSAHVVELVVRLVAASHKMTARWVSRRLLTV